jgi:hypothetical protein
MYKETLQAIAGIEIFPVLSLLLFVAVFGTVLFWTSRLDTARLQEFSNMPLDVDAPAKDAHASEADTTGKGVAL